MYMPTIASCVCIVPTVTTATMVRRGALIATTPIAVIVTIAVLRSHILTAPESMHLPHQQLQLGRTSPLVTETITPTSILPDTHAIIDIDLPRLSRSQLIPHTPSKFHYLL